MTQQDDYTNTQKWQNELSRRRLNRLEVLLQRRDDAARRWAEAMAHGTPDHGDSLRELMLTEQALASIWPATYAERCDRWIVQDAELIHSDRQPHPDCRLCQQSELLGSDPEAA